MTDFMAGWFCGITSMFVLGLFVINNYGKTND